jgi:hypothetical protein
VVAFRGCARLTGIKNVMKYKSLIAALLLSPMSAIAYDMERAAVNLSTDLAYCAGYLFIVSIAVKKRDPETSKEYEIQAFKMHSMAAEISNEKVATARMEMAVKDMRSEIDNNASNISILINQYHQLCLDMSNDMGPRLQYWLEKKD